MPTSLHVLHLEDDPHDAELAHERLRAEGFLYEVVRVDSRADFTSALEGRPFDLIVADNTMPGFDGLSALAVAREKAPDIPFIFVSGTLGEELAIESLKNGATDYVLKQRLSRLAPVVRRALHEAKERRERKRAEEKLRLSDEILQRVKALVLVADAQGEIVYVSPAAKEIMGYEPAELLGEGWWTLSRGEAGDARREKEYVSRAARGEIPISDEPYERVVLARDGQPRTIVWQDAKGPNGLLIGVGHDITERKRAENDLHQALTRLQSELWAREEAEEALRDSEERYRLLFELNPLPMWVYDTETLRLLAVNDAAVEHYGYERDEFLAMTIKDIRPPEELPRFEDNLAAPRQPQERSGPWKHRKKDRTLIDVEIISHNITFLDRPARLVLANDVTERKRAEQEIKRRLAELEAVHRVSTALRTAQTLDEMLPRLLDETLAVLDTEAGIIFLYDAARDEIRKAAARGWFTRIPDAPMQASTGIAGLVLETGQAQLSRELASDPRLRQAVRPLIPAGMSAAAMPIRTVQEIVGLLFISLPLPREVTPDEVHLLTTLTEIAGNAIHRTRLHEQTEQRLKRLQALREIDQAITSSLDLRLTLGVLLQQVTSELKVNAAVVFLLNPYLRTLQYAAGRGFRSPAIERDEPRLGQGYAGRAALEQRLIGLSGKPGADEAFVPPPALVGEGFTACYAAPLVAKGKVKGVLEVFHRAPLEPDPEWLHFFESLAGQAAIAVDNAELFEDLQHSNAELVLAYDSTIEGWSRALDLRDKETEGHTLRVTEMTLEIARAMGTFSEKELVHIQRGALLHDIGKMGVPDHILLKPGKLTDEEWATMRKHPQYAYDLLSPIAYLRPALDIPHYHHEKWDGTGYPRGLKGEQIPLAARLFAVVDVWDALRSDRPYRTAWPEEKVREHLRSLAGTHFDPKVVEMFLRMTSGE